jgi:putative membrane protein
VRLVIAWAVIAVSLLVAAALVPGVSIPGIGAALVVALIVGVLNAVLPPIVAALRLPLTVVVISLPADDAAILLATRHHGDIKVSSFWTALLASVVASAVSIALDAVFGVDDDETYTFRVIHRIARRSSERGRTSPASSFRDRRPRAPVLRRACATETRRLARWLAGIARHGGVEADPRRRPVPARPGSCRLERGHSRVRWVEKEAAG